jgi:hypothetical protein
VCQSGKRRAGRVYFLIEQARRGFSDHRNQARVCVCRRCHWNRRMALCNGPDPTS